MLAEPLASHEDASRRETSRACSVGHNRRRKIVAEQHLDKRLQLSRRLDLRRKRNGCRIERSGVCGNPRRYFVFLSNAFIDLFERGDTRLYAAKLLTSRVGVICGQRERTLSLGELLGGFSTLFEKARKLCGVHVKIEAALPKLARGGFELFLAFRDASFQGAPWKKGDPPVRP